MINNIQMGSQQMQSEFSGQPKMNQEIGPDIGSQKQSGAEEINKQIIRDIQEEEVEVNFGARTLTR
jgi:Skp family chaperone for outer membrane proteins